MFVIACLTLAAGCASQPPAQPNESRLVAGPSIAFVNGNWFDGTGFKQRTMYSVDGVFATAVARKPDSVIDLAGAYIVPPFGEAHNHNVEFTTPTRTAALLAKYVKEGVFYDQNPSNLPRARDGLTGFVNAPNGIDVTFSNGGLTATGGHPTGLFQRNLQRGTWTAADGDGGFLWYVDSLPDLDRKWPRVVALKPDFIKTFLLYSEEYERRRSDSAYFNWRGLNPDLLPEIVHRAHAAGLRVMTHIETAADFHNALAAGVDQIMHMPGFRGNEQQHLPSVDRYVIADSDAALAAKDDVIVVTTLESAAHAYPPSGPDSADNRRLNELFARNLRTLKSHHVTIAIGSDNYRETSVPEARYLASTGIFSNLEVLRMWSETTPLAIFPRRKIGRLEGGYEASFLALDGNPLVDFANTGRIRLRVKQGQLFTP
jgi:imidazolonepropionase-like amidohydrolase